MTDAERLAEIRHRSQFDGADGIDALVRYLDGRWLLAQLDTMQAERDQYRRSYEMAQSLLETSEQRETALRAQIAELSAQIAELNSYG